MPGLCSSCHTIKLPVFDRKGHQALDEHGQPESEFEQTTFFEWLNSAFFFPGDQPCQQCHMPGTYRGADLSFKIANIEDNTFPPVPDVGPSTRLPDSDLAMPVRNPYGRHQLNGINLFVLEMFDQFHKDLGSVQGRPQCSIVHQRPDIRAEDRGGGRCASSPNRAGHSSGQLGINRRHHAHSEPRDKNLAGHNFPSGVSFRRAFVNFQVLDPTGARAMGFGQYQHRRRHRRQFGNSARDRVFQRPQQKFQPHFWTNFSNHK